MKWIKRIFLSFILLLVLICLGVYVYLYSHKPSYSGDVALRGLQTKTEVYFDNYGVPHIYGQSEIDVYRTLGYIHAQERLFQIELIRRVSSGRLSEIFGSAVLDVDKFFRMLGINEHAEASAKAFSMHPDEAWNPAALAYLDGMNDYIENGKTPIEFTLLGIPKEKYTVKDMYLVVSYVSFNFQMAFRTDPLLDRMKNKLGIEYLIDLGYKPLESKDSIAMQSQNLSEQKLFSNFESIQNSLPFKVWNGSNSVIISAQRSSSGKVLFENDTHIGQQQPSVWYESHLEYPGFRFYGSSIAGFPFPALGHSERHAWGLTIFENDDLDFYKEKINPEDSDQVWERDHWADLNIRTETIKVKDSADVVLRCRTSVHGPVCSDVMKDFKMYGKEPISACWTFLRQPNSMVEVTYEMAHSKNIQEFKNATSKLAAPGLNVLYADVENNIAWWAAAKIVKRPENSETSFVLDGASGKQDWIGYYDFEFNPASINPDIGFVYSCNQTPEAVQGIVYPGYYLPDDRSIRMKELLHANKKFSLKDLQAINQDVINPVTSQACKILMEHLVQDSIRSGTPEGVIIEVLKQWNGEHRLENIAPSFYYRWYYHIYMATFVDELGQEDADAFLKTHFQKSSILPWLSNDSSRWWDDIGTQDKIESMTEIVNKSFQSAFKDLTVAYGPNPKAWKWEKLHTLELEHPLGKQKPLNYLFNVGPFPIAGGLETLNNQSFTLTSNPVFKSNLGAALRRTIDFADPENGMGILPGGQSGNPMSKHYADQTELYVRGELRKEMMNKEEILSVCKDKLVFLPSNK